MPDTRHGNVPRNLLVKYHTKLLLASFTVPVNNPTLRQSELSRVGWQSEEMGTQYVCFDNCFNTIVID